MQSEWNPPRKIYLAGKIGKDDWRGRLLDPDLLEVQGDIQTQDWPIQKRAVFNRFDYVGPYFTFLKDEAHFVYASGHADSTHGSGAIQSIEHADTEPYTRYTVAHSCLRALKRADALFAWMPTDDAFGTIAEIGAAVALGKPVAISAPSFSQDQWFVRHLPGVSNWQHESPEEAFYLASHSLGWMFDSPVEHNFWQAWMNSGVADDIRTGIVCQFSPEDLPIRIDFAHPRSRTAIEIDGFTFHSDEASFARDRQRDRMLAAMGWTVIRFTGREAMSSIELCVQEAQHIVCTRMPFADVVIDVNSVPLLEAASDDTDGEQDDTEDDNMPF